MDLFFSSRICFHDIRLEIKRERDERWKEKREKDPGFEVYVVEGQERREERMVAVLK